jgi:hypothetical protein
VAIKEGPVVELSPPPLAKHMQIAVPLPDTGEQTLTGKIVAIDDVEIVLQDDAGKNVKVQREVVDKARKNKVCSAGMVVLGVDAFPSVDIPLDQRIRLEAGKPVEPVVTRLCSTGLPGNPKSLCHSLCYGVKKR